VADSPSAIVTERAFARLIDLLDSHGARGFGHGNRASFREVDRWWAARTLFACLPVGALELRPGRDKFAPVLRAHLSALSLPVDQRACLVLKGIIEQMIATSPAMSARHGLRARRKYGVADVRALGRYAAIDAHQRGRCDTCGRLLMDAWSVELDHIVPFTLIGDIPDGSNWRLLCGDCNLGKHEFLSSWLAPDSWNWIGPANYGRMWEGPTLRARYTVLSTQQVCINCSRGAGEVTLHVGQRVSTALPVPTNLSVYCEEHIPQRPTTRAIRT
jgi:hypothetical protein